MNAPHRFSEPPPPPPVDLFPLRLAGAVAAGILIFAAPRIFGPIVAGLYLWRWFKSLQN